MKILKITGKIFGRLTVLSRENNDKWGHARWLCSCECGGKTVTHASNLRSGTTKSCGCLVSEGHQRTHGYYGTKVYKAWDSMKQRCNNQRSKNYGRYGGRGISICALWNKFENFLEDMGCPPTKNHSLDRIDNDGNYRKSNCRWSLPKQQCRNRSDNHLVTHNGETLCVSSWGEKTGICRKTIAYRLRVGWSVEKTLTTPTGTAP